MGACLSNATKVSGSNSNNATATEQRQPHRKHREAQGKTPVPDQQQQRHRQQRDQDQHHQKDKEQIRRNTGLVPCGKRTNFGYSREFDGKYAIGKLLGHGQFGYTYVATDKANGDRVAVKRIDKNKMILPISVEDVKREVKILQALTGHENVVQFYNAFEDNDYVYIVME